MPAPDIDHDTSADDMLAAADRERQRRMLAKARSKGDWTWEPIVPSAESAKVVAKTEQARALLHAQTQQSRVVVTLMGGSVVAGTPVSHHNDVSVAKDAAREASNLRFVLDDGQQFALNNVIRVE